MKNTDNFIMLPTADFCFKELMKNDKVRKGFVAAILDVMIELEDGTLMNMEMQVASFKYWINRVLFYIGKIYTGQIREGEDYEKLQNVSMSASLISTIFRRMTGATGKRRSVIWRQENCIQIFWNFIR